MVKSVTPLFDLVIFHLPPGWTPHPLGGRRTPSDKLHTHHGTIQSITGLLQLIKRSRRLSSPEEMLTNIICDELACKAFPPFCGRLVSGIPSRHTPHGSRSHGQWTLRDPRRRNRAKRGPRLIRAPGASRLSRTARQILPNPTPRRLEPRRAIHDCQTPPTRALSLNFLCIHLLGCATPPRKRTPSMKARHIIRLMNKGIATRTENHLIRLAEDNRFPRTEKTSLGPIPVNSLETRPRKLHENRKTHRAKGAATPAGAFPLLCWSSERSLSPEKSPKMPVAVGRLHVARRPCVPLQLVKFYSA